MNKKDIREGLAKINRGWTPDAVSHTVKPEYDDYMVADRMLQYLDSCGVVLKVEGELPNNLMIPFYCDPQIVMTSRAGQSVAKTASMDYSEAQQDMLKAGYTKTESLILKEVSDGTEV